MSYAGYTQELHKIMQMEHEYCKEEEEAFFKDPTDVNRIKVLSKRSEYQIEVIRSLVKELWGVSPIGLV